MAANYWVATPDGVAPWPCAPLDSTLPTYAITPNAFLVDMTFGQVSTNLPDGETVSVATALTNLAASVAGVIQLAESAATPSRMRSIGMMAADDLTPPGDGDTNGYGSYTNSFVAPVLNSNLMWLAVGSVDAASGIVYASLHRATNEVYFILSATNLTAPLADWQIETEVRPTDTNSQPFTLLTQGRDLMFFCAFDATGVDSDADGVPDWFSWLYWKSVNLPDTNLDYSGNGNTFAQDYSNNIVPTVFNFTGLEVTNAYVNVSAVPVQLAVAGKPFYLAMLIDDPNFTNANWQAYATSNMTVNLGLTEGSHDVWVGLRGHGDDPTNAVWRSIRLNLDYTPPALTVTSPTNGTVDIPMIQVLGSSPETLSGISYDLTNAAGLLTNQPVLVLNQYYDMAAGEFTTNTWQAFDVGLTNGINTFTFHAADLAGNVTTTNFSVTLDYSAKTNPPLVQITWPQPDAVISGSEFTLDGQVSDATVAIAATITDNNGSTNTVRGLVERNGKFWVENLPLNSGTNSIILVATDAVGNCATNNFNVMQTAVTLTVNPVSDPQQLWNPKVSLTGTISDAAYAIWVNGVKGHNNGDGTWTADNVPVNAGGTASFTVTGYAPNEQQPDGSYGN